MRMVRVAGVATVLGLGTFIVVMRAAGEIAGRTPRGERLSP